jgi:lysophospholipase L1-like esterase
LALRVAKELCSRFGLGNISQEQRQLQTLIRNQIMVIRKADIDAATLSGDMEEKSNSWYAQLVKDVCAEGRPRSLVFQKWLRHK